jgi:hypothetical protein
MNLKYDHEINSNVFIVSNNEIRELLVREVHINIEETRDGNIETPYTTIKYTLFNNIHKTVSIRYEDDVFYTKEELLKCL